MRTLRALLVVLTFLAFACGTTSQITPTLDVNVVVTQTLAAYTLQAAVASATPSPAATSSTMLIGTPIPETQPEEIAPNPLPASHAGILLHPGECLDMESGTVLAPDLHCDVLLLKDALLRGMNLAVISGYAFPEPPSLSECRAARYEGGDLALQTNLYMCVRTSDGYYGFIVGRAYGPGYPPAYVVLDYWVFR